VTRNKTASFIGYAAYMLLPIGMYYYPGNYMSDMLAPLFFAATTYYFLRIIFEKKSYRIDIIGLIISLGLLTYTEYLGLAVSGTILLYGLFDRSKRYSKVMIWIGLLVPVFFVTLSILQFASVGSVHSILSVLLSKYT